MSHSYTNFPFPYQVQPQIPQMPQMTPMFAPALNQAMYAQSLPNILSMIQLKNTLQTQLLQLQLANLANKNMVASAGLLKHKISSPLDTPSPISTVETKPTTAAIPIQASALPEDPEICLEAQVKYMVQFFVNNFGRVSDKEIQAERQKFAHDERLLKVFDTMITKYSATTKTREEMVKWIIRRALKTCKQSIKASNKMNPKKTSARDASINEKLEDDQFEDWLDSMLPFRKNSKNKTMNSTFIAQIFESQGFRDDYKEFLNEFDEVTDKDTVKKAAKLTSFIIESIKKEKVGSIAKYKRVPWLKVWVQNTKKVALELEEGHLEEKSSKRVKSEDGESF